MKRSELEHVIRGSGAIADDDEIIVIGSESVLGQIPAAPATLLASMETGIYPKNKPDLAAMVDGSIGEGSFFHAEYGYYAQGVGPNGRAARGMAGATGEHQERKHQRCDWTLPGGPRPGDIQIRGGSPERSGIHKGTGTAQDD